MIAPAQKPLHLARWVGNSVAAVCGVTLTHDSRWTVVRGYFNHPKYQPDLERCRRCEQCRP